MAPLSAARGLLAAAFQRVGGLKNLFTNTRSSYSQQACVSKTHPIESSPTARYHTPSTSLDKLPSIGPNYRRRSGVPIYSHPGSAIKKHVSGPSSLEKQARMDRIQKGLLQSNDITEKEAPVASTHAAPSSSLALASYKEHHVKATKIAGSRRVSHPAGQLRSAIKKQRSGPSSVTKHAREDRIIAGLLKEDEGSDTKTSIYTSVSAVFPSSFSTPGSMIEDDIPLDDLDIPSLPVPGLSIGELDDLPDPAYFDNGLEVEVAMSTEVEDAMPLDNLDLPSLQMPGLSIGELGDLPDPAYFNDGLEVEVTISTEAEDEVLKDVEPSEGFDREFVNHVYDLNPSGNADETSATAELQSLEMADGPSNDDSWVGNQFDGSGDVELTDLDAPPAPADDHGSGEDFSRFPSGSPAYEPAPLDCPWYPQDLDVSSKKKLELFREWLIAESYQDDQPMAKIEALESAREALMTPEEDMDHYTYSGTNSDDEKGSAEEPLESTDDSTSLPQDSQVNINFVSSSPSPYPSPALISDSFSRKLFLTDTRPST